MTFEEWWAEYVTCGRCREKGLARSAWAAAVAAERERCAAVAEGVTTGVTGFVESDRIKFAVKNMHKLRQTIADLIRATP